MIMMLLLIAAKQAAGQTYLIDRVCSGAQRHYRIDGETGSRYMWQLTDSLGNPVSLTNQAGISFYTTDSITGQVKAGSEIIIPWNNPGTYRLAAVQYSPLGCDTLQQGEVLVIAQSTASSGNPVAICSGSAVTLSGASASNYSTLLWSSSGDGLFDNPLALNPTYKPGPNDLQSGSVILTLTAQGNGSSNSCTPAISSVEITLITTLKALVSVIADHAAVCQGALVQFTAIPENGGTIPVFQWKVNGINAGSNTNTYSYTPVNGDKITVTMTSNETCVSGIPANSNQISMTVENIPSAPLLGAITQPTCSTATGSVVLNRLPAGGWTINPGAISGTGASTTITGLKAGTYNFAVTDASGCTSGFSANIVIHAQPVTPAVPSVGTITQPTCGVQTGSVILSGLPGTGTWTLTRSPDGSTSTGRGTSTTLSGLSKGIYTYTVTNSGGCTSGSSANIVINGQPVIPAVPIVGNITQPTCTVATGSVILSGLPATSAWRLTRTPGAMTTLGTGVSTVISGLSSGTYTYTVTNADGCTSSPTSSIIINAAPGTPIAPTVGVITQPGCALSTGSVALSGLPASGTWTLTRLPDGATTTGSGTGINISGLISGTYSYTLTNSAGCTSGRTSDIVINTPPPTPLTPLAGTIIQPDCATKTGSIVLSGLPAAGNWTLIRIPGGPAYTAAGTSFTISGLPSGSYSYTVTNAFGCTSALSSRVLIKSAPVSPNAPTVGTIIQPGCTLSTGSVTLTSLPANGSWTLTTNPGGSSVTGAGTNTTISGLATGNYNYSVTNSSGCTSPTSANVVINVQPSAPSAPTFVSVTRPTCSTITGTLTLSGLPATGNWILTRIQDGSTTTGNGTNTTISALSVGNYAYIVTDANGCTSPLSQNIFFSIAIGPGAVETTITNQTCGAPNGVITLGSVIGGTPPYTFSVDGSVYTGNKIYTNLPEGLHTIVVKDNNDCNLATTVTLTNSPAPSSIAIQETDATCGTSNGTLSLGTVTGGTPPYSFSVDGSAFTPNRKYINLAAGSHTIIVKDNNKCNFSTTATILNISGPTAIATQITDETCEAGNGALSLGSVAEGTPPYSYSVDGSAFTQTTTSANLKAGSHTIIVKDNNGCNYSTTAALQNISGPTDIAVSKTDETCGAANGVLSLGTVTGGTPPYSYSADGSAFSQTTTYANLKAGSHTIIVKDNNGCNYSTTASLQNISGPTDIAVSKTDETCGASNGVLSLGAVTGGIPPYSYSIDGSAFTQKTTYANLTAGLHTINVKDNNDCNYSTTVNLLNTNGPTAIETQITEAVCGDSNGELSLVTVTAGTAPFTYSADGNPFTETTHYTNLSAGPHTIVVKDKNGCNFSTSVDIAQPPATSAIIKGDTAICAGSPIPITIEMTGTAPWSVIYTDGINSVQVSNIMSSPYCFNVSPSTNTTYTLTSVTDANCTGTLSGSAIITVTSRVNPTFTQPGPFLLNTIAPLLPGFSLNGISGRWSPATISTAESGTTTYTFTPDSNECASKTTVAITINIQAVIAEKDSLPASSVIHSGACQRVSLDGSKSIGDIISYQWSLPDHSGCLTQQTGVNTEFKLSNDYAGSLPAHFRVRLFVTDKNGYTSSDTITVNVDPSPVASVTTSGTLQKDGSMIVDGSFSIGTDITYEWSTSDGKIVGPDNSPTAKFVGAGMYRLKITDIYGCQSIKDFKFSLEAYRIIANPDYYRITWAQDTALNVLANDSLPPGYNTVRVIKQATLGKTSVNSDLTITYSPTTRKPGHDQFEYEICNIDLCDSATVTIDIANSNLIIPQGFSPNGDGVNDLLKFEGLDHYKPSELTIYTRSGRQIYTSADYQNEWDGRMSNQKLVPTGVYYYVLKLGQTNRVIKGFLYIGY